MWFFFLLLPVTVYHTGDAEAVFVHDGHVSCVEGKVYSSLIAHSWRPEEASRMASADVVGCVHIWKAHPDPS